MIKDYEDFKKFVLQNKGIDLNAYKERQMKRISMTDMTAIVKL